MTKNRHKHLLRLSFFLAVACAVHYPAIAAKEDVSRRDPQRWYQGADTPRLHHENLMKEAHAAYAQALKECKLLRKTEARRACHEEARTNMRSDLARARRIFKAAAAGSRWDGNAAKSGR
ncbi:MAG TPA: hypothetical protein VFA14_05770 [Herbaspirillum sp.]|nr:hypothetical protein [Herbaspirillum sp.]